LSTTEASVRLAPDANNYDACALCNLENEVVLTSQLGGFAIPSLGAYVEGWTLVVPRKHVLSLADLSPSDASAFEEVLVTSRARVSHAYGSTIVFEHGSSGAGRLAGCGVDHAHAHVVPTSVDDVRTLVDAISPSTHTWQPITRPWMSETAAEEDYLWILDSTGSWLAEAPELPSQLIRRALAHHWSIVEWDWRAAPRKDLYNLTAQRLA
jgi:ATP adenylyltransferase